MTTSLAAIIGLLGWAASAGAAGTGAPAMVRFTGRLAADIHWTVSRELSRNGFRVVTARDLERSAAAVSVSLDDPGGIGAVAGRLKLAAALTGQTTTRGLDITVRMAVHDPRSGAVIARTTFSEPGWAPLMRELRRDLWRRLGPALETGAHRAAVATAARAAERQPAPAVAAKAAETPVASAHSRDTREADIFGPSRDPGGGSTSAPEPTASAAPNEDASAPASAEAIRDRSILGGNGAAPGLSQDVAPDNPLVIGGQFYLRTQSTALDGQAPRDWSFSSPSLLDAYLDARPNSRVRGLVLGRLQFDPTRAPARATPGQGMPAGLDPSRSGPMPTSLLAAPTRGPVLGLDQLWLRFDVARRLFVTLGKQHVRWGTARLWTPADFLHVQRRNPLDVFDARAGTTMLKLHLPWEKHDWNFYAYGITELAGPIESVADVAGAARAELVLGTMELGLGAMIERARKPKFAADLSVGIWELDLYGEAALRYASEIDRLRYAPDATFPQPGDPGFSFPRALEALYPAERESGLRPQLVGGLSFSLPYADKDEVTVGAEYFYNALGYDDPDVYPGLLMRGPALAEPAVPFYFGRHYAALYVFMPQPFSWDQTSFNLSILGNLSDRSSIGRLNYSVILLTHLYFEAFASLHFGPAEGEFRSGIRNIGPIEVNRAPSRFDLGIALRISL